MKITDPLFKETVESILDDINLCRNTLFEPMDDIHNQFIESMILLTTQPKTIWELGAGDGHWIVNFRTILSDANVNLVENFEWANDPTNKCHDLYKDLNTKEKLEEYIKAFNFSDISVYDINVWQLPEQENKIDLIRLDCGVINDSYNVVQWIENNGSDRLVIFVDDAAINKDFSRMLTINNVKNLDLIITTDDFACFARPGLINVDELYKLLLNFTPYSEHFYQSISKYFYNINNKVYNYIAVETRPGYANTLISDKINE